MPGPLPKGETVRRNAPTIPTTALPVGGFQGVAPDPPVAYELGVAGREWWVWAWSTPQAAAWSAGDLYALARRASFEDDLARVGDTDFEVGLDELDGLPPVVKAVIQNLKGLAVGKLQLAKEARELDDRFGLSPKGLAALRWKIVEDAPAGEKPKGKSYGHLKSTG